MNNKWQQETVNTERFNKTDLLRDSSWYIQLVRGSSTGYINLQSSKPTDKITSLKLKLQVYFKIITYKSKTKSESQKVSNLLMNLPF